MSMLQNSNQINFKVDGYDVTAAFAPHNPPSAFENIKQILLSSFFNNEMNEKSSGYTFAFKDKKSDNKDGKDSRAP